MASTFTVKWLLVVIIYIYTFLMSMVVMNVETRHTLNIFFSVALSRLLCHFCKVFNWNANFRNTVETYQPKSFNNIFVSSVSVMPTTQSEQLGHFRKKNIYRKQGNGNDRVVTICQRQSFSIKPFGSKLGISFFSHLVHTCETLTILLKSHLDVKSFRIIYSANMLFARLLLYSKFNFNV